MFVVTQAPAERLVRLSLTLIAVAMLFAIGGVRSAMASCGDYVMVGTHVAGSSGHTVPDVPTCHGPNCQRQVPPPIAPTNGLINTAPGEMAYYPPVSYSPCSAQASEVCQRSLLLAERHSLPLLRPPCL